MPLIRPFDGYIVDAAHAGQVVAPSYDAVSPSQRRHFAEANPGNYLNAMRLREDFPPEAQPGVEELLAVNKAKLEALLTNGSFRPLNKPGMFLYRLSSGAHHQTGVICEVPVEEYRLGRVRKHESTRRDKEDLLAMYQRVVGVSSSPICLAYPHDADIAAHIAAATQGAPLLDFTAVDQVHQQVWPVEEAVARRLTESFAAVETTYLTDGHHRAAAGWRHAEYMRAASGGDDDADAPHNRLLVALFSADELTLLPFHRAVRDLNGLSEAELVGALQRDFEVREVGAEQLPPETHGEFGMRSGEHRYRLRLRDGLVDTADPVASLDVSILQDHILAPHLGITDARSDPRLDYVAGAADGSVDDSLAAKCADGWAICFACHPTSMAQLMTVADAGALMPPKSTCFDPKPRSGIFIRRR